jgi:hypothetical protein
MKEEGKYWDGISENELTRHCRFLIHFSYLKCVEECNNPNRRAQEFYDKNVKAFPDQK